MLPPLDVPEADLDAAWSGVEQRAELRLPEGFVLAQFAVAFAVKPRDKRLRVLAHLFTKATPDRIY